MTYQITGALYTGPWDMPFRMWLQHFTIDVILILLIGNGTVACVCVCVCLALSFKYAKAIYGVIMTYAMLILY